MVDGGPSRWVVFDVIYKNSNFHILFGLKLKGKGFYFGIQHKTYCLDSEAHRQVSLVVSSHLNPCQGDNLTELCYQLGLPIVAHRQRCRVSPRSKAEALLSNPTLCCYEDFGSTCVRLENIPLNGTSFTN